RPDSRSPFRERKARRAPGAVQQGASRRGEDPPRTPMQGSACSELPTARQRAQLAVSQRRSAGRLRKSPVRAFLLEDAAVERISDAPGGGGDRKSTRLNSS